MLAPAIHGQTAKNWTATDHWVWEKIKQGEIADLDDSPTGKEVSAEFIEAVIKTDSLNKLVPPDGIRVVHAVFRSDVTLNNITLSQPLWLNRCVFYGDVSLFQAKFQAHLSLFGSAFLRRLYMDLLESGGNLNLSGVMVRNLELNNAKIGGILYMNRLIGVDTVGLNAAQVRGKLFVQQSQIKVLDLDFSEMYSPVSIYQNKDSLTLWAQGATFKNSLRLDKIQGFNNLYFFNSELYKLSMDSCFHGTVYFSNAQFTKNLNIIASNDIELSLQNATLTGDLGIFDSDSLVLNLFRATIGRNLSVFRSDFQSINCSQSEMKIFTIESSTVENQTDLRQMRIHVEAKVRDVNFRNGVSFSGSEINGPLLIERNIIGNGIGLRNMDVADNLSLAGSIVQNVYLTNSEIQGDLLLSDSSQNLYLTWTHEDYLSNQPYFDLSNTSVNSIQDSMNEWPSDTGSIRQPWPDSLNLSNFVYQNFELRDKSSDWFIEWLGKSLYDRSSYELVAESFMRLGKKREAKEIRKASGRKQLELTPYFSEKVFLTFMGVFTGYGQSNGRIFLAMFVMVIIGLVILQRSGEARNNHFRTGFFYSLDRIIPIVNLDKAHEDVKFSKHWVRYYFYFHHLFGYLLVTLLLASLADDLLI